jgi:4-hydroxybenzoate polyprenyltransferase
MPGTVPGYLGLLRVRSWIGWVFYCALGFLLFAMPSWNMALISAAFISATAGIFVLNQCYDLAVDRLHFEKRELPIAAGAITPSGAFSLYVFSTILCMGLVLLTDISLIPLFAIYIGGGICYSVPPLRMKSRPVLDVLFVGTFSGVVPFLIGAQASHQLILDWSSSWALHYQDALLVAMILFLFQCSTHIFQAVGDYEADRDAGEKTSVVKYGKANSAKTAKILLTTSLLLPFAYGVMRFPIIGYEYWYLVVLLPSLPLALYFMRQKIVSKEKVSNLTVVAKKAAPRIYAALFLLVLLIRLGLH